MLLKLQGQRANKKVKTPFAQKKETRGFGANVMNQM